MSRDCGIDEKSSIFKQSQCYFAVVRFMLSEQLNFEIISERVLVSSYVFILSTNYIQHIKLGF